MTLMVVANEGKTTLRVLDSTLLESTHSCKLNDLLLSETQKLH